MLKYVMRRVITHTPSFTFATTAYRDTVDYYGILEVDSGATESAIRQAYADLTQGLRPQFDTARFKQLNEAFVILTDSKTREAYDSLLGVRKSYYLSPEEETAPAKKSYLATRKITREQQLKKKANIDEFGRYKGGLPRWNSDIRGKSLGEAGTMHRQSEIEEEFDKSPEFNNITTEKAESFKNFHQDERKARTMKWPWFTSQVDYDYFTFKTFRVKYWPKLQFLIFFFYILPTLYYTGLKFYKEYQRKELKAAAEAHARELERAKQENVQE